MSQLPAYEREPYRTDLATRVVQAGEEGGRPYVVLEDTILFPEGGGQPADRGTVGGVAVLDVRKKGDEVRHFLERLVPSGPVQVHLNWDRRFDLMQQHTGQHLLTAVAQNQFGWATTAFHLGEEMADIELDVAQVPEPALRELEAAVAAEIRQARPVSWRWVPPEQLPGLNVRSRGLPEGFHGDVRLVEIQGLDLNTCGGTHLRSTCELECLCLLGTESLRGGTRVFFVAGGRARRRMAAFESRNAALRALLGAPDSGLVPAVTVRLEQHRELERKVRLLEDELAQVLLSQWAASAEPVLDQHFEGKDAGFLQRTARQLIALAPGKTVFFTATQAGQHAFLVAAGEASALDPVPLGREVAALLSGKGGGSGRLFQGKAGNLEGREQALARVREAIAGA